MADITLSRSKTDEDSPTYRVTSEYGTLAYDSHRVELSADGDLPPWAVASGYATDMDVALHDWREGSEGNLWQALEAHYREMVGER